MRIYMNPFMELLSGIDFADAVHLLIGTNYDWKGGHICIIKNMKKDNSRWNCKNNQWQVPTVGRVTAEELLFFIYEISPYTFNI